MKNKEYDPIEVKERLSVARRFLESIDPDKLGKCPDTIALIVGVLFLLVNAAIIQI